MHSIVQFAPRFTPKQASALAEDEYGISGTAVQLASERDQNFKITGESGDFVLKIANASERYAALDFQNQAQQHLLRHQHRFGAHCAVGPEVLSSVSGQTIVRTRGSSGNPHFVRLLRYVPGNPLAQSRPHDAGLLNDLGRFFAAMDTVFMNFEHPAAHREFHWDLRRAPSIIAELLPYLSAADPSDLVQSCLSRFQKASQTALDGLAKSVIHNDGNDYNILVITDADWRNRINGVIDFGDMVYTHTINELAIVCAYAMLGKADPLSAACRVIAGYHALRPVTERELAVLFDLICMRLCLSVCHSAHQAAQDPANAYLRISEGPVWQLLRQLHAVHPRLAGYLFRDACGMDPVPFRGRVLQWIQSQRATFASVVQLKAQDPAALVLDLSVAGDMPADVSDETGAECMQHKIDWAMRQAKANVGIGRYDECRIFYNANSFQVDSDAMPEQRGVHLGIDLFVPPGTPVTAFSDATVHSAKHNRRALDYGPTVVLQHVIDEHACFYTLYGHLSLDSLNGLRAGQKIAKGQAFGAVGDSQINGGWPPHLHFQIICDMLGQKGDFPGAARPSQRRVWCRLCPDPDSILGMLPPEAEAGRGGAASLDALRRRHFGHNLSLAYRRPIHVVRGIGQYLYDPEGRAYLDGVNNVCHVGHCHPKVVDAGQRQMARLNTNTRYLYDPLFAYTQRLLQHFPEPLRVCYFVCSGSEANELALRLARSVTGAKTVVALKGAYHGNTQTLIDISAYKHEGPGGGGAPPWVHAVSMPDGYRGLYNGMGRDTGLRYASDVKAELEQIAAAGEAPATFICEPLLGCGGQIVLPQGYLQAVYGHVRRTGGVCIADEVQVGFGRVGTHYWAFETQGVVPDIVTLGKPIGNGHPLAAVITTREIADVFANGMEYFNTFGGNPVSCAIGMAVMDVIEAEGLQAHADDVGRHLRQGFHELKRRYSLIGDVRGLGLFIGVELVKDRETREPAAEAADYIINRLRAHGILLSTDGPCHNVLKLKPPMVFSHANADRLLDVLDRILQEDCLQRFQKR